MTKILDFTKEINIEEMKEAAKQMSTFFFETLSFPLNLILYIFFLVDEYHCDSTKNN